MRFSNEIWNSELEMLKYCNSILKLEGVESL
jgi:hypothetical protein